MESKTNSVTTGKKTATLVPSRVYFVLLRVIGKVGGRREKYRLGGLSLVAMRREQPVACTALAVLAIIFGRSTCCLSPDRNLGAIVYPVRESAGFVHLGPTSDESSSRTYRPVRFGRKIFVPAPGSLCKWKVRRRRTGLHVGYIWAKFAAP